MTFSSGLAKPSIICGPTSSSPTSPTVSDTSSLPRSTCHTLRSNDSQSIISCSSSPVTSPSSGHFSMISSGQSSRKPSLAVSEENNSNFTLTIAQPRPSKRLSDSRTGKFMASLHSSNPSNSSSGNNDSKKPSFLSINTDVATSTTKAPKELSLSIPPPKALRNVYIITPSNEAKDCTDNDQQEDSQQQQNKNNLVPPPPSFHNLPHNISRKINKLSNTKTSTDEASIQKLNDDKSGEENEEEEIEIDVLTRRLTSYYRQNKRLETELKMLLDYLDKVTTLHVKKISTIPEEEKTEEKNLKTTSPEEEQLNDQGYNKNAELNYVTEENQTLNANIDESKNSHPKEVTSDNNSTHVASAKIDNNSPDTLSSPILISSLTCSHYPKSEPVHPYLHFIFSQDSFSEENTNSHSSSTHSHSSSSSPLSKQWYDPIKASSLVCEYIQQHEAQDQIIISAKQAHRAKPYSASRGLKKSFNKQSNNKSNHHHHYHHHHHHIKTKSQELEYEEYLQDIQNQKNNQQKFDQSNANNFESKSVFKKIFCM